MAISEVADNFYCPQCPYFNVEGPMAEADSPTIARLRVRIAIREARDAAGLTQVQVADAMEWSHSKVIRIENGDNTISIADLRGLLALLNVRDKDLISSLLADARVARRRQQPKSAWWHEQQFREHLSLDLRRFIEFEAEAVEIHSFNVYYIHGPLQTPEYGAALTGAWSDDKEFPRARIAALVEARQRRREGLMRRVGSVQYSVLVDESALLRSIGGPRIYLDQLRQVVDLYDRGLVKLRMLPFTLTAPIANNGSFELLRVGADRAGTEVMYRENGVGDETVENRDEIARHRHRFNQLWGAADSESDTIAYIQKRIDDLEANPPG